MPMNTPGWAMTDEQRAVLAALLTMQRQSWEQGVLSHALLDLGLHDEALLVAEHAVARQTAAGKLGEIEDTGVVNCGALGEVVAFAATAAGDRHDVSFAAALGRQLDWLLREAPRAADGTLFHLEGSREVWVDTVYMVVPLLVRVGQHATARTQLEGHRRRLFDPATGLYGWRWSEDEGRVTHPQHWGTGNGWVVAGIARSLRHGGADDAGFRTQATAHARVVVDAMLASEQPDGFHDVLDDPSTFDEGNVRQMLAYAILTGSADGWLPDGYRGTGLRLLDDARRRIGPDGTVRGVCAAPRFDRRGLSPEAQAMFLLASAAAAPPTTALVGG